MNLGTRYLIYCFASSICLLCALNIISVFIVVLSLFDFIVLWVLGCFSHNLAKLYLIPIEYSSSTAEIVSAPSSTSNWKIPWNEIDFPNYTKFIESNFSGFCVERGRQVPEEMIFFFCSRSSCDFSRSWSFVTF